MSEIFSKKELNNAHEESNENREASDDRVEVSAHAVCESLITEKNDGLSESRETSEIAFTNTVEHISQEYESYISELDKARLNESIERSRPEVMTEIDYITRFPENDFNVLGHFDPVNEKIYIKDNNNEVLRHVSSHEAVHLCSHNEITSDNEGHTVVRSGIMETAIGEDGIFDRNRGLNEGLTEMYALRELKAQGDTEAAGSITSYPEASGYAYMMEDIVGREAVADAYFGGNIEQLRTEFIRLNDNDETAWESFSKDVETVEYGTDNVEITSAKTRLSIMLMEMTMNADEANALQG